MYIQYIIYNVVFLLNDFFLICVTFPCISYVIFPNFLSPTPFVVVVVVVFRMSHIFDHEF